MNDVGSWTLLTDASADSFVRLPAALLTRVSAAGLPLISLHVSNDAPARIVACSGAPSSNSRSVSLAASVASALELQESSVVRVGLVPASNVPVARRVHLQPLS